MAGQLRAVSLPSRHAGCHGDVRLNVDSPRRRRCTLTGVPRSIGAFLIFDIANPVPEIFTVTNVGSSSTETLTVTITDSAFPENFVILTDG